MSITEGNFQIFYQIFNHQECTFCPKTVTFSVIGAFAKL
jgi:hypothetical protein